MAAGYDSTHHYTEQLLRELGIGTAAVVQGWGYADASAGFHEPEGNFQGRKYSSCFDLGWHCADDRIRNALVAAGVCVFPRYHGSGWSGAQHIHCVQVGLRDDAGRCRIAAGPRQQIVDYCNGRNGLAGHGPWQGIWEPTEAERARIREEYSSWVPDIATRVYLPDRTSPAVNAWLEDGVVTCEVRPLVEVLHGRILDSDINGVVVRLGSGGVKCLTLPEAYRAGEFLRAGVRSIAGAMGYTCTFQWSDARSFCKVYLGEATA